MAEVYPHPKMNFPKWVENFWYHYRWQFLFALAVVAFIAIAAVQSFIQKKIDASILYVGPVAVSDQTCHDIVASAEEKFTRDYDGSGRKSADIRTIHLSTELDGLSPKKRAEADKRFTQYVDEILSGEDCFLLVSPSFYENLDQKGVLMSVYEIFGAWRGDEAILCGIPLNTIPLGASPGFRDLPPDTVLCLRYAGGVGTKLSENEIEEKNLLNAAIFRDLCS